MAETAQSTKRSGRATTKSPLRRVEGNRRATVRRRLLWTAAVLAAAAIAGIGVWQLAQPNIDDGATYFPSEGAQHFPPGTTLTYSTYPPASGPHYSTVAAPGFYRQPVPEGNWVHSLEHGYIVVLYKPDLPPNQINKLEEISFRLPNSKWGRRKIIVAPYERMDAPITAVAWEYKLPLSHPDEEAIRRFYINRVDKGPEDVP